MQGWLHGTVPVFHASSEKQTQTATGMTGPEKPSNTHPHPRVGLISPWVLSPQGLWGGCRADGHRRVTPLLCPHPVQQDAQRSPCGQGPLSTPSAPCTTACHSNRPPSISFPLGAREGDRLAMLLQLKTQHSPDVPSG